MGKRGQHYDEEFRRNAFDHWIRSRKYCQDVAADLGISENSLRQWKKIDLPEPDGPSSKVCVKRWND